MKLTKTLFILMIILSVILLASCAKKTNICGNNICELKEDCNNCVKDCGCEVNEYCDNIGVCRGQVCGDSDCSQNEKSTGSCCVDCGCPEDQVCNKVNQECQNTIVIDESKINQIVEDYLETKRIEGKVTKIKDTYYKEHTVKQVNIDCGLSEFAPLCKIILYIDEEGKILEDIKTS